MALTAASSPSQPSRPPQIVAGIIEERGIERVLGARYPLASSVASFVVRTGNTFVGSLLWVDFVRLLGAPATPPARERDCTPREEHALSLSSREGGWKKSDAQGLRKRPPRR